MIEYPLGQSVRLTAAFQNAAGVAADPTTITFKYALQTAYPPPDPTATNAVYLTNPDVVRDSTGNYHFDFVPAAEGNYIYQVVGTGTVAAVTPPLRFRVLPSPFA